jgi:hypothetical protein
MKRIRPLVPIAGIAFTENRFPPRRTTGVLPFSPQVRPVTWSERIPTWPANRTSPPSLFAFARIAGQVSPCQRPHGPRVLLHGPLARTLEGQPPARVQAHREDLVL